MLEKWKQRLPSQVTVPLIRHHIALWSAELQRITQTYHDLPRGQISTAPVSHRALWKPLAAQRTIQPTHACSSQQYSTGKRDSRNSHICPWLIPRLFNDDFSTIQARFSSVVYWLVTCLSVLSVKMRLSTVKVGPQNVTIAVRNNVALLCHPIALYWFLKFLLPRYLFQFLILFFYISLFQTQQY
jgi:hypothetical protein